MAGGRHGARLLSDWACPQCETLNFAKRHRCNKCGVVKPKTSAATVDEAPAALRKGDWLCTGCQNVNWARRDKCNICFTSKPALLEPEDVQRTGRAGGHNDLQDPHDRSDHNSDDEEFDEFGRKKRAKKASRLNAISSITSRPATVRELKIEEQLKFLEAVRQEGIKLTYPPAPIFSEDDEEFLH